MSSHDETAARPAEPLAPSLQSTETPAIRKTWPGWLGALLLILAAVLAYIPAMRAGFIWDDDAYLYKTDQNVIVPADGLKRIWTTAATPQWYPMVFTTYWFEYRLGGAIPNHPLGKHEMQEDGARAWFNPTIYHVVNILLHAFSAVLIWRILLWLKVPGAWLAAAIFAVHPVHVETVAWITERKNTLSTFFYLAAMLAYLRFADRKDGWWYLLALGAFVLALFSKTVTCTLPVAILLALWLGGQLGSLQAILLVPGLTLVSGAIVILLKAYGLHAGFTKLDQAVLAASALGLVAVLAALLYAKGRVKWFIPVGLVPFFVAGLFMGKLTGWYEFHKAKPEYWEPMPIAQCFKLSWTEDKEAGARSEYKLSTEQRVIIAARSLLFYTQKLVVPYPQSFFYHRWNDPSQRVAGQPVELDTSQRLNYWPVAAVLGIGVVVVVLSILYGRGIFIAFAFFAVTLFPALGFFDTYPMRYSFVADHFQYLASIGPIALIAAGLAMLFRRFGGTPIPVFNGASAPAGALALVLLVALGAKTALRCEAFRDEETLWLDTIAKNPHAWGARVNLGIYYANRGDHDKAAEQLQAMVDDDTNWQEAYSNLGNIYALRRDFTKAEAMFRKAIELEPRLADLYSRLAKTLRLQKKDSEVPAVYEMAGKVPRDRFIWSNQWVKLYEEWADLLDKSGQKEVAQAKREYAEALRKEVEAMEPKPAASAPAVAAEGGIDLGGATTPRDRRSAYLRSTADAITRRDYVYAMRVVQAGCEEFPTSAGLWKKYGLLIAASPLDQQRDGKQAVALAEKLRMSLESLNALDDDALEILGAAYAEVGEFDKALGVANEGLRMAQTAGNAIAQSRFQWQIKLFQERRPYRLPPASPVSESPGSTSTQPAGATATRPSTLPTTRRVPITATQPNRIRATQPVRLLQTRPAVAK